VELLAVPGGDSFFHITLAGTLHVIAFAVDDVGTGIAILATWLISGPGIRYMADIHPLVNAI
jgi:hypothetical protein